MENPRRSVLQCKVYLSPSGTVYSMLSSLGQFANRDVGDTELDEVDDVDVGPSELVALAISDVVKASEVDEAEVRPPEVAEPVAEESEAFETRIPESVCSCL